MQSVHSPAKEERSDKYVSDADATPGGGSSRVVLASVMVAAAAFLLVLLSINHALFTTPIMEYGDFAANGIQIERAKHFRELLGNYSRWGFHHPGPGFLYIFAFGEGLFHDLLHIVPAEMNAHVLTIILLNSAFLFGCIAIVAKRCRSQLFVPAAVVIAVYFIHVVNRTVPGSALLSIWPPHILMFCFLFFVTVAAAVAMGENSKLPLLAFSGLLLIHGHAAQPLFVGTLSILSLGTLWFQQRRVGGLRFFLKANYKPVILSLFLVALFALPIVVDVIVNKPNNIQAILRYTSQHRGIQTSPKLALAYEASFFAFVTDYESVVRSDPDPLIPKRSPKRYVEVYWCVGAILLGILAVMCMRRRFPIPRFFKYLAFEILAVLALFYVWTLKMAGPLFNFNGYFIYCVQLLALLLVVALILNEVHVAVRPQVALVLCALAPLTMFADRGSFENVSRNGDAETVHFYDSIPKNVGPLHLVFSQPAWPVMVSIANRFKHEDRPYCVDEFVSFSPAREDACHAIDGLSTLLLTDVPRKCNSPCRVLARDSRLQLQLIPYPYLKLPVSITLGDMLSLNTSFYGNEQLGSWSSRKSAIHFRLLPDFTDAERVRVTLLGTGIPGRPARISLNGHALGTIVAGPSQSSFVVDRSLFLPGAENQVAIEVDNAAPVGNDPRNLGFYWSGLRLEAVRQ